MIIAHKTLFAIKECFARDGGALYRHHLRIAMSELSDAYSQNSDPFRSHLGASQIGEVCDRQLYYNFRWATLEIHSDQQLRLFNRGHLEEGRLVALLRAIGVNVFQFDANGKQYRLSDCFGHFGGSGDGFCTNLPDAPHANVLLEFKTHNDKSFAKLIDCGVELAKPVHYSQIQTYHSEWKTDVALYIGVNKNNDAIHCELIPPNPIVGIQMRARAQEIIFAQSAPVRAAKDPSSFICKFCKHKPVCFGNAAPHRTCRTCQYAQPVENGNWHCCHPQINQPIPTAIQFTGCGNYIVNRAIYD